MSCQLFRFPSFKIIIFFHSHKSNFFPFLALYSFYSLLSFSQLSGFWGASGTPMAGVAYHDGWTTPTKDSHGTSWYVKKRSLFFVPPPSSIFFFAFFFKPVNLFKAGLLSMQRA
jgi:hypothetical protein